MKTFKPINWALLFLILLAVFAVRSPLLFSDVLGSDASYQARAAETVLNGGLLYRDVPYTYPPLYAYTEALAISAFGNTSAGWKATSQIYDFGVIILIYLIVNRISSLKNAAFSAVLYGLSPLPLVATSSYASFDSTAAFWMMLCLFLLSMKKPMHSAVALGIGSAYKYFPLALLPAAVVYLSTKRQRLLYTAISIGTVAIIQIPFMFTEFNDWLNNVVLFHLYRAAEGATIYNLISFHPQLWNVQTPLTVLSPITLALVFILIGFSEGKSEIDLLKNSAFILVSAVFFSKVVFFYALWYVPFICILLAASKRRISKLIFVPFLILQIAIVVGANIFYLDSNLQFEFIAAYTCLATSGFLVAWLGCDRLVSAKRRCKQSAG
jgi:uncharacterized membrane protein